MVCYAEKEEKPFWFSPMGQIILFETIKFRRTFENYFLSVRVDWKKVTIIVAFHFMKHRLKMHAPKNTQFKELSEITRLSVSVFKLVFVVFLVNNTSDRLKKSENPKTWLLFSDPTFLMGRKLMICDAFFSKFCHKSTLHFFHFSLPTLSRSLSSHSLSLEGE